MKLCEDPVLVLKYRRGYNSEEKRLILASVGSLEDRTATISQCRTWPLIPQEIESVRSYALEYPQIGYKRLTWQMVDDDVAYLKPYQVYEILKERSLLRWGNNGCPGTLNRPPEPDHPDVPLHSFPAYARTGFDGITLWIS